MFESIDCDGVTDIGRYRETNEDQFLIADLSKSVVIHRSSLAYADEAELHGVSQGKLLLVADGVGGSAAGERASSLAVEGVVEYLLNAMHWLHRFDTDGDEEFLESLKSAVFSSQGQIQQHAQDSPELDGMATTITMAYVIWPKAYIVHVGDSRAYLFRDSSLQKVTHDQTIAQDLADAGLITEDRVEHHPFSHVLSSLVGCDPNQLKPSVLKLDLRDRDVLLLCTDGLTREVSDSKIADIIAMNDTADATCRRLLDLANVAGGIDNITIIVARMTAQQRN